jgi:hypothetical protein
LSWAGTIDDASISDRWSLALLCAARELEAVTPNPPSPHLLAATSASADASITNRITAESLNQLFFLGSVFEIYNDQFSTKDRLALCALRVAAAALSDAAALRMADDLVGCFILARDEACAGHSSTGQARLSLREMQLSSQDRAVLQRYVQRIVECVSALPQPTSKAALDEIFRSWFAEINNLVDAEEVNTEMFKLKIDFLRNVIRNADTTNLNSLSLYFDDSLEMFIDWSSTIVLKRTGIARDYALKGIFIPVAAAPIRRGHSGESTSKVVAALRILSAALARDLASVSTLWCAILNEGSGSRDFLDLVFSDAAIWDVVVACFLSSDAIVRKRACFIAELFIQRCASERPAPPAAPRLWLEDFVDAYRQVEGCSYLHLVYQVLISTNVPAMWNSSNRLYFIFVDMGSFGAAV